MMRTIATGFTALAFIAASACLAQAEPNWCKGAVSGRGHANIEESGNPDALACRLARWAWKARVRANCDRSSPWWWRASDKHYTHDAGAGQRYCKAIAIPARKIF